MNKIIENLKSGNYEVVDNQGVSVTENFTQCLEKEFADQTDLIENLKQQLADTETQNKRVLEKLELIVRANQELEQKLAEKEKEIEGLKAQRHIYLNRSVDECNKITMLELELQNKDQDKISFAVEQLEKVKELVEEKGAISSPFGNLKIQASDVSEIIDNQIKAIKEIK